MNSTFIAFETEVWAFVWCTYWLDLLIFLLSRQQWKFVDFEWWN